MSSFSDSSKDSEDGAARPVPAPQSTPPGGAGKGKTRIGSGDMGGVGGSSWQGGGPLEGDSQRSVPHSHLKDMAIDALEISRIRDQQAVCSSLARTLGSFDMQPELAEVLSSMVFSAYSSAQECSDDRMLFLAYSCFTDAQLRRIFRLARGI